LLSLFGVDEEASMAVSVTAMLEKSLK